MKIPHDELVKGILLKLLRTRGIIHSQQELAGLLQNELATIDRDYRIASRRARRVALELDRVDVLVKTRASGGAKPARCPVCGARLRGLWARNLLGRRVQVGFRCTRCSYYGTIRAFEPMHYEFRLLK